MSEPTDDTTPSGPASPDPPAEEQSVAAAPAAPAAAAPGHTRTILEVVGGVVAGGLIVIAGIVGFVLGNLTSDSSDGPRGDRLGLAGERPHGGPQLAGGQDRPRFPGQFGQGQGQWQGHGHEGGQRPGMPGPRPTSPAVPDQGLVPSVPASPSPTG
ncbi:MAG: hypothetical protein ACYC2Z_02830 [Candidatus Nanopelagicales bacterium]